jgi:hypothetical protein
MRDGGLGGDCGHVERLASLEQPLRGVEDRRRIALRGRATMIDGDFSHVADHGSSARSCIAGATAAPSGIATAEISAMQPRRRP